MVGLARGGLRLEDRTHRLQVFLPDRAGFCDVGAYEVPLRIYPGIDRMINDVAPLGKFDGLIVARGPSPDGIAIDRVLGLPDANMMTPRNHRIGIGQRI